ncbi:Uncharacterized protein CLAVI_000873 [Candidatus Clavichlamydia salmonicola]|uniref:cyclic nucleotide-binding domain-containing protein n=1 Tax=Candidatus Clavichlamydia salmonicola TaxID=469812 RepID=UPI001891EB6B|nr:cyclic nucleotide-binding domain-containing protein [Candidatus Clavichlamydia salmonicola]MBF5051232.1 Uncharacterized protein [Candidatus Clavichlamydia salmonicola]
MNNYHSIIEKAFLLKTIQIFSSLDLDLLLAIADKMEHSELKAGDIIFSKENQGSSLYIIAKGIVNIIDANDQIITSLSCSDFFGEETIFNDKVRTYSAVCNSAVTILSLQKNQLFNIIFECPSVAISIIECYADNCSFRTRRIEK